MFDAREIRADAGGHLKRKKIARMLVGIRSAKKESIRRWEKCPESHDSPDAGGYRVFDAQTPLRLTRE